MDDLLTAPIDSQNCKFCALASSNSCASPRDRWIATSEHFVALPSIGALVDGWVLIVPRPHVLSLGDVGDELGQELDDFTAGVSEVLQATYELPVTRFEHGSSGPMQSIGCGVDHAHLHLVPLDFDLIAELAGQHPHLTCRTQRGGVRAAAAIAEGGSYIFVRNGWGDEVVVLGTENESQLLRRVIAGRLGVADQWNWREHPQVDRADRCGRRLEAQGLPLVVSA